MCKGRTVDVMVVMVISGCIPQLDWQKLLFIIIIISSITNKISAHFKQ